MLIISFECDQWWMSYRRLTSIQCLMYMLIFHILVHKCSLELPGTYPQSIASIRRLQILSQSLLYLNLIPKGANLDFSYHIPPTLSQGSNKYTLPWTVSIPTHLPSVPQWIQKERQLKRRGSPPTSFANLVFKLLPYAVDIPHPVSRVLTLWAFFIPWLPSGLFICHLMPTFNLSLTHGNPLIHSIYWTKDFEGLKFWPPPYLLSMATATFDRTHVQHEIRCPIDSVCFLMHPHFPVFTCSKIPRLYNALSPTLLHRNPLHLFRRLTWIYSQHWNQ